jgi:hypothetical protein
MTELAGIFVVSMILLVGALVGGVLSFVAGRYTVGLFVRARSRGLASLSWSALVLGALGVWIGWMIATLAIAGQVWGWGVTGVLEAIASTLGWAGVAALAVAGATSRAGSYAQTRASFRRVTGSTK